VIRLPLEQGEHDYSIQWSEPRTTEVVERLPVVRFESFAKNIEIVTTPDERWIVWLEQRGWGPFVGWWQRVGAALIVTLVVLFLERRRTSLLWFIPFLGVITIPSAFVLLIPLALVVLTLTKERAVGRIAGGVAALAIAAALVGALGATPEMSIVGQENGPLRWFLPERLNEIPSVAIISLPTWGWKVFATLWAASAVLFVYLRTREVPSP